MKVVQLDPGQFSTRRCVCELEGGVIYETELGELFHVIEDESTIAWLLEEEALPSARLINVLEFDTATERAAHLQQRFGRQRIL